MNDSFMDKFVSMGAECAMMTPTTRDSLLLNIGDQANREAWYEFVEIYEPTIYRLLRNSGVQDADARDLTQEILVKVNQQVQRWSVDRRQGSFRAWLRVVTRNLFVSWQRQRQRKPWDQSLVDPLMLEDDVDSVANDTAAFDREEERSLLRLALKRVREEVHESTWMAFFHVVFDSLSIEETAKRLQISAGAVRVAKCRVQARLKKLIDEIRDG